MDPRTLMQRRLRILHCATTWTTDTEPMSRVIAVPCGGVSRGRSSPGTEELPWRVPLQVKARTRLGEPPPRRSSRTEYVFMPVSSSA